MEKEAIKTERKKSVVKKNDLVQRARYRLDLVQQKTLLYLISQVDSVKDKAFGMVTINIKDLCQIMGIQYNGKNVLNIKDALKKIADKSFWIELHDEDDTEILLRWLDRVSIAKGKGTVTVKFPEELAPYLLKITDGCFTEYTLANILPMKSHYSLRLYELFMSRKKIGKWDVSLSKLKELLFIESGTYEDYRVFRIKVIDTAIKEICNYSDLCVAYEAKRRGSRSITHIVFYFCGIDEVDGTEGTRRIKNRDGILESTLKKVVPPKKLPTVRDIQILKEKERKAKELEALEKKYLRAKTPIDYSEPAPIMPGQTAIEDLI